MGSACRNTKLTLLHKTFVLGRDLIHRQYQHEYKWCYNQFLHNSQFNIKEPEVNVFIRQFLFHEKDQFLVSSPHDNLLRRVCKKLFSFKRTRLRVNDSRRTASCIFLSTNSLRESKAQIK